MLDFPCKTLIGTGREKTIPELVSAAWKRSSNVVHTANNAFGGTPGIPLFTEVRKSAKRLRCDAEATVVSCRSIKNFHQESAVFVPIRTNPHNFYSEAS